MRLFSSPGNIDPMSIISSGSTRARGLSSRFSEEVNVLDFGAQGDGVTDDAPPSSHRIDADNLFRQVRRAGGSARSYAESMPLPAPSGPREATP